MQAPLQNKCKIGCMTVTFQLKMLGMNKEQAIKMAGDVKALANLLGITHQAVYAWKTMPPLQIFRLKELKPRWFRREKAIE